MTTRPAASPGWMRCLPREERARASPEWNHYRVSCQNGVLKLAVNGKEVSGASQCVPAQGLHLPRVRRLGVPLPQHSHQELPSTHLPPSTTAALDRLPLALFGARPARLAVEPGHAGHWRANDSILQYDGQQHGRKEGPLDREGIWRFRAAGGLAACPAGRPRDPVRLSFPTATMPGTPTALPKRLISPTRATAESCSAASGKAQVNITCNVIGSGELYGYRVDKSMPFRPFRLDSQGQGRQPGQMEPVRHHAEGRTL